MPPTLPKSYISGVFLQISARPSPRLTAAALRHSLRRPVLLARLAGWAALALAALLEVTGNGLDVPLLLAGVALAVAVPLFLINNGVRRVALSPLTTYEISDSGVAFSNLQSRHAFSWAAFTSVDRLPGQLLFRRKGFVPVPTAGLTEPQINQVLATAAAHGLKIRHA
jgi:hypothetical protein